MDENKQTIEILLDRYEELIKKEALLDKIMEDKDFNIYLYSKEGVNNA